MNLAGIIARPTSRPPRVILVGGEKVGKSTFASQAPSPIMLPIRGEEGLDALAVPRFPTADTFKDVLLAIKNLTEQEHQFKTLVIDSASALEPLVWEHVCEVYNWESIETPGYGKGYIAALETWRKLTAALDKLRELRGIGVVIVGHAKVKIVNDPLTEPYDAYIFDVNDKTASLLYRWADSILFATKKVTITKAEKGSRKPGHAVSNDQRVVYTKSRPGHPGGGRGAYGELPYELPLAWPAFAEAVAKATKEAEVEGKAVEQAMAQGAVSAGDKLVAAFAEFGVTKEIIEGQIGHSVTTLAPTEMQALRLVYKRLKEGDKPGNHFDAMREPEPQTAATANPEGESPISDL